ncbi:MarR family winged helix-turn-helix transcriptional regulator [Bacillus sp. JJ722]|uniref:MarR family winged helix-turn-helix transcriptional regulator n=1 Tax=Bacillus sp. JJ722 TaxID=3122973 RepID=UPI002FFF7EEA
MYSFFSKIALVRRIYTNRLQEKLNLHGVTTTQWALIRYLKDNGSSTLSDVADFWHVEKPSITPIVQKLVAQEIIIILSGEDKRQKIMKLSEKGISLYQLIKQTTDVFLEKIMEGITQEEREIAEQSLNQLFVNLQKRG